MTGVAEFGGGGPLLTWRTANIIQITLGGEQGVDGAQERSWGLSGEPCRVLCFLIAPTGQSLDLCA